MKRMTIGTVGIVAMLAMGSTALAEINAAATTDLNVRSGPGPQYPVIGVIGANQPTEVVGCLESGKWCQVAHNGKEGWAYGDYLATSTAGQAEVVAQLPASRLPNVPQPGATAGAVTGVVAGALIGGPVGAIIGGIAGATTGAAIDNPPPTVQTYVTQNAMQPVYLEGEVVVGAGVPGTVELRQIPDYGYSYAYVNGQPVLVDPGSRRIVYVYR